jgi:hypothetical protein
MHHIAYNEKFTFCLLFLMIVVSTNAMNEINCFEIAKKEHMKEAN